MIIPPGSEVYIQMPRDVVYKGTLQLPSRTHSPTVENLSEDHVLVRGPNMFNLIAGLRSYVNNHNNRIQGYYCYIKFRNDTVLKATLVPDSGQNTPNVPNRVFVRLPIPGSPVFTGVLSRNVVFFPYWLLV